MTTSRRQFFRSTSMALAGAALLGNTTLHASPMNQPLGFQAFEIIPDLVKDWQGTWKKMAGFGYKFVDLVQFSPSYAPALAAKSASEIRDALLMANLGCYNCHFPYGAFTGSFQKSMAFAHQMGVTSVVCGPPQRRKTVEDWKWMGDMLNQLGSRVKAEGLLLGYHNHEVEFAKLDGQVPWDVLMAGTDPELVQFQIDVGNLAFAGADPVTYLEKYSNRYFSLHCKDLQPGQASVPVGKGSLDWKSIFAITAKAGIKSYVAEVGAYGAATMSGEPLAPSPLSILESFRQSFVFLNQFQNA